MDSPPTLTGSPLRLLVDPPQQLDLNYNYSVQPGLLWLSYLPLCFWLNIKMHGPDSLELTGAATTSVDVRLLTFLDFSAWKMKTQRTWGNSLGERLLEKCKCWLISGIAYVSAELPFEPIRNPVQRPGEGQRVGPKQTSGEKPLLLRAETSCAQTSDGGVTPRP